LKKTPEISKNLCPEAQEFLRNVVSVMEDNKMMTNMDVEAVELLGVTYHNWFQAQKTIFEDGQYFITANGDKKVHPCVKIALDEKIQLTKLFETLGLTPKARKEISKSKERAKELSPLDRFISSVEKR
jgi:P27 family predicted phage terminase small subunit